MGVKVSIIIPTFNRASYLGTTLASVLAQTIIEWECIVVDDGSQDGTEELLNLFVKKDSRFVFIRRPSHRVKGGNSCRNIGLEHARGEFIQFLDSDDLISPNKIESQLSALKNGDLNSIATCRWGFFNSDERKLHAEHYRPTYISTQYPIDLLNVYSRHITYLPAHVFLVRKEVLERAGPWNESLYKHQDTEFFIRVLLESTSVLFVPTAEAYYRTGTHNSVRVIPSIEKVKSAILCWKLVNDVIYQKNGINNHAIIRVGKTELYKKIKKKYPEFLKANEVFFSGRYSKLEYLFIKIISRSEMLYFRIAEPLVTAVSSDFRNIVSKSVQFVVMGLHSFKIRKQ